MPFDNPITIPAPVVEDDSILKLLLEGRARIAKGWCQHAVVRRVQGEIVAYCSFGAVRYTNAEQNGDLRIALRADRYLDRAVPWPFCFGYIGYNETTGRTQGQMLAMWDRAIALRRRDLNPPPTWWQRLKAHFS